VKVLPREWGPDPAVFEACASLPSYYLVAKASKCHCCAKVTWLWGSITDGVSGVGSESKVRGLQEHSLYQGNRGAMGLLFLSPSRTIPQELKAWNFPRITGSHLRRVHSEICCHLLSPQLRALPSSPVPRQQNHRMPVCFLCHLWSGTAVSMAFISKGSTNL
jgi:hypothetical protein